MCLHVVSRRDLLGNAESVFLCALLGCVSLGWTHDLSCQCQVVTNCHSGMTGVKWNCANRYVWSPYLSHALGSQTHIWHIEKIDVILRSLEMGLGLLIVILLHLFLLKNARTHRCPSLIPGIRFPALSKPRLFIVRDSPLDTGGWTLQARIRSLSEGK